MQFDRDDLIAGLRDLVDRMHTVEIRDVSIRIIGGAALRLAYFERATTVDIDAAIEPIGQVTTIVDQIALDRGWPADWLNDKAAMFIPAWGRSVSWTPVFDEAGISIEIASAEALLAMKLNAARPGRDTDDIVLLLAINDITSVAAAESLFESFYPGDALTDRAVRLLDRIFDIGLPPKPVAPPTVDLT